MYKLLVSNEKKTIIKQFKSCVEDVISYCEGLFS